jgi:hypothetical protein
MTNWVVCRLNQQDCLSPMSVFTLMQGWSKICMMT